MEREVDECVQFLKDEQNLDCREAYKIIVDCIINGQASELLKDLYETNKIKLRMVINIALKNINAIDKIKNK